MPKINSYLLLGVFSLLLFLPGIAHLPVIDRDEAHFTQATRQMLQTGEYFKIRFQERTRFQKPPGINWLQAASVQLFSDADATRIWPYRIPSVLGALFSVWLTYFFARRVISERSALMGAAFLASSLLLVVEAHMSVIDTSLLSSVLLMQGALWVIYSEGINHKKAAIPAEEDQCRQGLSSGGLSQTRMKPSWRSRSTSLCFEGLRKPSGRHPLLSRSWKTVEIADKKAHWGWALLFWVAMAYGFVLKGVTPLVGILSIMTLCIIEKRFDWLRGLRVFSGLLLFIVLSLTWLLLVNAAEQSNYLLQMIHKDLLPKLQGGHESHGQPPLFHLAILPITFWPASLFLWQGAVYAVKMRHLRIVRFLLAWIVPTWIFFEIMPTKLPQYTLPTFPAIALLCALAIESIKTTLKPSTWLRFLQVLWGFLSVGLAATLFMMSYWLLNKFLIIAISLFLALCLMSVVCVFYAWRGVYSRARLAVLLAALITFPFIFSSFLPQLKPLWISRNMVQFMDKSKISDIKPLLVVGYTEPSLVFYLNTRHVLFTDVNTALMRLRKNTSHLLLIDEVNFKAMASAPDLVVLARSKGYNYSKGKWVQLLLLAYPKIEDRTYEKLQSLR